MSKDKPRNLAASVRARLSELARKQGEDFQLVLTRYVIERFLFRLASSPYRNEFVLKGAMLFRLWTGRIRRPTRDLDLLGKGDQSIERMVGIFKELCSRDVEGDGLAFASASVRGHRIKEDQDYEGVRVECEARLEQARIDLQIDIGFGDAVTPRATEVEFPTLLEFPAPVLRAYPRQTVVAEKYQAMVSLGIANSRMKDFFDLWVLARLFEFDGPSLSRAIEATFERRKTALPTEAPLALTAAFGTDASKVRQWAAFVKKGKLDAEGASLEQVCKFLSGFLMAPTRARIVDEPFDSTWLPGGPWSANQQGGPSGSK
jgi:predicted nucleotidyltransferase component of viral defense system